MRRRDFITVMGTAATSWPLGALAQQTEKPVIGFLDGRFPDAIANRLRGFHRGLRETGYVEGENVTVLYRYAENQVDRLPALAAELTRPEQLTWHLEVKHWRPSTGGQALEAKHRVGKANRGGHNK